MNKRLALFESQEGSLVIAFETTCSQGYCALLFNKAQPVAYTYIGNNNYSIKYDNDLQTLLNGLDLNLSLDFSDLGYLSDYERIHLINKLDSLARLKGVSPIYLSDYDSTGQDLDSFLKLFFDVSENIKDSSFDYNHFYFPKKEIDYGETWSSTLLTDYEKSVLKAPHRPELTNEVVGTTFFNVLESSVILDYSLSNGKGDNLRPYTLDILHGDPSSGKTTAVEVLCDIHNIPLIKLTGNPNITLQKLFTFMSPTTIGNGDNEQATFKVIESILFKCLRYNLPVVVVIEEANLCDCYLQSQMSDMITSGSFFVNGQIYKFDVSKISWVLNYNPDTYKASPWEAKLKSRAFFLYSKKPSVDILADYQASMFDSSYARTACSIKDNDVFTPSADGLVHANGASIAQLYKFIYSELNPYLFSITKGIDSNNPDKTKGFMFSDRVFPILANILSTFGFEKGLKFIVANLIPSDHVRYQDAEEPNVAIAENCYQKFITEEETINNLFISFDSDVLGTELDTFEKLIANESSIKLIEVAFSDEEDTTSSGATTINFDELDELQVKINNK